MNLLVIFICLICKSALKRLGGIFDYVTKKERLAEVELELAEPNVWNDQERAQSLGRERSSLEAVVNTIEKKLIFLNRMSVKILTVQAAPVVSMWIKPIQLCG